MRVGILTSGGDCPGLNPGIVAAAEAVVAAGQVPVGIRNGYVGLARLAELNRAGRRELLVELRGLDRPVWVREGGTMLGSRRASVHKNAELVGTCVVGAERAGLDAVIVFGGDGSLQGAAALGDAGLCVVGVPKTIDRDVRATDETIGFATATEVGCELVERITTTARSHDVNFLVEVMGRRAGHLAANVARAAGAAGVMVPEQPVAFTDMLERLEDLHGSVIVMAEGCWPTGLDVPDGLADGRGRMRLGDAARTLEHSLAHHGMPVKSARLGHSLRGGRPVAADRLLGWRLGAAGAQAALEQHSTLVAVIDGEVRRRPLTDARLGRRLLDVAELAELADLVW